eukprot:1146285-Pelagomonas_calceolata.AAC.2
MSVLDLFSALLLVIWRLLYGSGYPAKQGRNGERQFESDHCTLSATLDDPCMLDGWHTCRCCASRRAN